MHNCAGYESTTYTDVADSPKDRFRRAVQMIAALLSLMALIAVTCFVYAPGQGKTLSGELTRKTPQVPAAAHRSVSAELAFPEPEETNVSSCSGLQSSPKTGLLISRKSNSGGNGRIVSVLAGNGFTVGLRDNGRVVYAGDNSAVRAALAGWDNIERIELTEGLASYIIGYGRDGSISLSSPFTAWHQYSYLVHWTESDFASWRNIKKLYVGGSFSVGLCNDGSILFMAKGEKKQNELDELRNIVSRWKDIKELYVDWSPLIVALKTDGTIITNDEKSLSGRYNYLGGQWTGPETWNNVDHLVDCSVGPYAIKTDGTVLGIDLPGWTGIRAVYFGDQAMYGLRYDGTVIADFHGGISNSSRVKEVSTWRNIVQLGFDRNGYARDIPVGLCADGSVKAVTYDRDYEHPFGEWNVSGWSDIEAIYSGAYYTVGLKKDGRLLATGGERGTADFVSEIADWKGIDQVIFSDTEYITDAHVIGIRTDGTVVAAGCNDHGQCNVEGFNLT